MTLTKCRRKDAWCGDPHECSIAKRCLTLHPAQFTAKYAEGLGAAIDSALDSALKERKL